MSVLGAMLVLAACSSGVPSARHNMVNSNGLTHSVDEIRTNHPYELLGNENSKLLAKVFDEWVGTRYRFGGESKRGIDCSAFTRVTFEEAFGITLPRSTAKQRYVGRKISKNELKTGDLVFFRHNNHVGIYLGNRQFMHSSSGNGVMISSLDEAYWVKSYTQSRRIM